MANKVLAFFENAEKKIQVVAVDIVDGAGDAIKVFADIKSMSPATKTALTKLIDDAQAVATAGGPAITTDGLNVIDDIATVNAVKQLVTDFIALIPVLKADASTLLADAKSTPLQPLASIDTENKIAQKTAPVGVIS